MSSNQLSSFFLLYRMVNLQNGPIQLVRNSSALVSFPDQPLGTIKLISPSLIPRPTPGTSALVSFPDQALGTKLDCRVFQDSSTDISVLHSDRYPLGNEGIAGVAQTLLSSLA